MHPVHGEREHRDARFCCAEQPYAVHCSKFIVKKSGNFIAIFLYVTICQFLNYFQSRFKSRLAYKILRAGLELHWKRCESGVFKCHCPHHLTSGQERRHRFKELFLSVENSGSCGGINLMAGKGVEITVHLLHVHSAMDNSLRPVNENRNAAAVTKSYYFLDRVDNTQHI